MVACIFRSLRRSRSPCACCGADVTGVAVAFVLFHCCSSWVNVHSVRRFLRFVFGLFPSFVNLCEPSASFQDLSNAEILATAFALVASCPRLSLRCACAVLVPVPCVASERLSPPGLRICSFHAVVTSSSDHYAVARVAVCRRRLRGLQVVSAALLKSSNFLKFSLTVQQVVVSVILCY